MDVLTVELRPAGRVEADAGQARLVQGPRGEPGAVYVPSVTGGVLSWSNDAGLENPAPADITGPKGDKGDKGDTGAQGVQGVQGPAGTAFVPSVDASGNLSWSNDGGLTNPATVNIRGPKGEPGADGAPGAAGPSGAVFTPSVDALGNLSWTNNGSLPNPDTVNIRGERGETGPAGPAGPKGDPGSGLDILGRYDSLSALTEAVALPQIGDNYYVGTAAPYDVYTWTNSGGVPQWVNGGPLQGAKGEPGENGAQGASGATFTPNVDADGVLSWSNDAGLANPAPVNIRGPKGDAGSDGKDGAQGQAGAPGADGGYYTPTVNAETGALSWSASRAGMPSVAGANIKGPKGDKGDPGEAGAPGVPGSDGADGAPGEDGGYYTPSVDALGNLSWSASKSGMASVAGVNIKGPKGDKGDPGEAGAPGSDGADGAPGASATINGLNALTLAAGENVEISQSGSTVTISASGGGAGTMFVHISGSGSSLSADRTLSEISSFYSGGGMVYALWDGMILTPFMIDSSMAWFVYTVNSDYANLIIESTGGSSQTVYQDGGKLDAGSVSFDSAYSGLGADTVQEAIDNLMNMLGLV